MSVNIEVPKIGESVATVFVAQWLKQPGDAVKAGDPVVEVDSDKASMEVPSPVDGVLMETLAEEGEEIAVGVVIARVDDSASPAVAAAPGATENAEATPAESSDVRAGPAARQLANQEGVDLTAIEGRANMVVCCRMMCERRHLKRLVRSPRLRSPLQCPK